MKLRKDTRQHYLIFLLNVRKVYTNSSQCEPEIKRAPIWKIWHPEYLTEKCSCVPIKLFRHLEWNTPGSSRWYMRRSSNGSYRHFVDTKPCRWRKPKSIKIRKPNWLKSNDKPNRKRRGGKLYTLFTHLMPPSSVVLEPIIFGATFAKIPSSARFDLCSALRNFCKFLDDKQF